MRVCRQVTPSYFASENFSLITNFAILQLHHQFFAPGDANNFILENIVFLDSEENLLNPKKY